MEISRIAHRLIFQPEITEPKKEPLYSVILTTRKIKMKKALMGDLMSHLPLVRKTIILGPTFAAAVISDRTGMEVSADVVKKVCKKMAIQIPPTLECNARVMDHLIATFDKEAVA